MSVVIPCYNSSAFVSLAVESAMAQTIAVREVIVVDDGSTDDPASALSGIDDPRLSIVRTSNFGVAHARNLGADLAAGDLVAFLDADDAWYPSKLERQLPLFEEPRPPLVVGSQMHHVGARGAPIGTTGEDLLDDEIQQTVRAGELMPFPMSSAVIDRKAFQALGGFDEALQRDVPGLVEDLEFMARIAAHGPIRTVGEPLGMYRVHSGSASARRYRSQRQGARFVRARLVARAAGGELTWQEFLAGRSGSKGEWFDDTARSLYRAAGVLAADGHYVRAAARLCASVVLGPAYVMRRIRQQGVIVHLRNRTGSAQP